MAERVLPSREESAKRAGQLRAEGLSFTAEYLALDAIASDRLVDREAIDRERIEEILDELCRDWYDMVIREGKTFDFGAAIRALDAALAAK